MPLENASDDLHVIDIESIRCNFCNDDLTILPLSGREVHYEHHLVNDSTAEGLVAEGSRAFPIDLDTLSKSSNSRKSRSDTIIGQKVFPKKKFSFKTPKADAFWYPAQRTSPPRNYTPGLIPVLRKSLLKSHHSGQLRRAALCYDKTVHIRREIWDASWGCGYRNFLMACAALMSQTQQPMYFPLLDSPLPPSFCRCSKHTSGFDTDGKAELKKLIGTKKWVGTADIWVALVSRRIPAELVDFDFRNKERGPETLIDWVVEYFTPKATQTKSANAFDSIQSYPIVNTTKMPLILQHDGHSRTVVGYETDRNGITKLLIFDPAYHISDEIRDYAMSEGLEIDPDRQG
ncbi:DUF1671-domain-containing protein [Pholiota conissans]|uniref:DUF1671-domain-containing protein n=1 Tax=Pholiota conissans TaxID=109636 RepID=A0A9P5YRT6_9AGAR|nr:DUF1671-domain-containing protein [Pholiota conissans]